MVNYLIQYNNDSERFWNNESVYVFTFLTSDSSRFGVLEYIILEESNL